MTSFYAGKCIRFNIYNFTAYIKIKYLINKETSIEQLRSKQGIKKIKRDRVCQVVFGLSLILQLNLVLNKLFAN